MNQFNRRQSWDREHTMLNDRIRAAITHWLKGDPGAAFDEGLLVMDACIDGEEIVVTIDPVGTHDKPFQVCLVVTRIELQTSAAIRQSDGRPTG